jgi:xanthine dehydrogenase small subunit
MGEESASVEIILHWVSTSSRGLQFHLNGEAVDVADDGASLLEVLRDRLGVRSVKDGCSPQGQCGCCTVLVDGQPRVSCVTPARRVRDRSITTVEGLADAGELAEALCATGGSQCGFCTPGIIARLSGLRSRKGDLTVDLVNDALKAHLCRCTGWQTVVEAAVELPAMDPGRDLEAAGRRASIEGRSQQRVGVDVALGEGGFADDAAPADALVAVRGTDRDWVVAETLSAARTAAGKIQGRRTTRETAAPIDVPDGDFAITLQTSWVDPAYLETDASWAAPDSEPATPLANGGAFGAKVGTDVTDVARALAVENGRPVRVLASREDTARYGPKRPPMAAGVNPDGTGVIRVAATPGISAAITAAAPGLEVVEVEVPGPPTTAAIRGAGWVEAVVLLNAATGAPVVSPDGATATATFDGETIDVSVSCGQPLDTVVLRSYCIGAAHMAYSWVTSESLAVDPDGEVLDLTVRSFGVVRAVDMPPVVVSIEPSDTEAINGSDAVFAAVAAAVWRHHGHSSAWPIA